MQLTKIVLMSAFVSCGNPEGTGAQDSRGQVEFVQSVDGTIAFVQPKPTVGSEFVAVVFEPGDGVRGGGESEQSISVEIEKSFAFSSAAQAPASSVVVDHTIRSLMNRFEAGRGVEQGDQFWKLARIVDDSSGRGLQAEGSSLTPYFRRLGTAPLRERVSMNLAASSGCPDTIVVPPASGESEYVEIEATENAIEKSGFCILMLENPTMTTEPDVNNIVSSIERTLDLFRNVIYADTMAAHNGFIFEPIIVLVDLSNEFAWPSPVKFTGAFDRSASKALQRPILYVATDIAAIGKGTGNVDKDKSRLHATIAHELQHAAMYYFKEVRSDNAKGEWLALDEGIAHFVEDLCGYGEEVYDEFAKPYLLGWIDGTESIVRDVSAQDGLNEVAMARGGPYLLVNFFIARNGGVEFQGGTPATSAGLDALKSVVTSKTVGLENLSARVDNWSRFVGQFFAALVLDGVSEFAVADDLRFLEQIYGVENLQGTKLNSFSVPMEQFRKEVRQWDEFPDYTAELPKLRILGGVPFTFSGSLDGWKVVVNSSTTVSAAVTRVQ